MISSEFALLRLSLMKDGSAYPFEEAGRIIASEAIDWQEVLRRAKRHRIRPQLYEFLSGITSTKIPAWVQEQLADIVRENMLRQLRNVSEYFRLISLMESNQITALPFKGFWLANELYGNIAQRESGDVDLFIDIDSLDRIIELMPGLGYSPETAGNRKFIEREKKLSAEFNFDKREGETVISHFEFHWRIGSAFHGLDIGFDDLASYVIRSSFQDHSNKAFDLTASFLLAIMHHGAKDHLSEMRHILDIGMFLRKQDEIDWQWVLVMARRFNLEKQVYTAVRLAADLTGAVLPESQEIAVKVNSATTGRLAANRMRQIALSPGQKSELWHEWDNLIFQLRSRTGFMVRVRLIKLSCMRIVIRHIVPERLHKRYRKIKEKRFAA